jgi:hypothetical protein
LKDNYECYKQNVIKLRLILEDQWRCKYEELERMLKAFCKAKI